MMTIRSLTLWVAVLVLASACTKETPRKTELTTEAERFSYALGLDIGANVMKLETEVDIDALVQAIRDTTGGLPSLMTPEEASTIREDFANKYRETQMTKARDAGQAFLEENKTKDGVITTASGLQYVVITRGTGPKPKATDRVKVHYRGTLIDGTEFDSSYSRGEPTVFSVGGLISGWSEALQLMNVGSKYKLFVPPELAYGEHGAGGMIGPNATLIFDIELIDIED